MIEWVAITAAGLLTAINSKLGHKCPDCDSQNWLTQKDLGNTMMGQHLRVMCGSCKKIFKVRIDGKDM